MFDTLNSVLDQKANIQAEATNGLYTLSQSMPNVLDYFYSNLQNLGYNLEELKPALEQSGTTLVLSCAGSGKTTYLVLKLIRDYLSGEYGQIGHLSRIFISTFLKTGAEELKNSFDEYCSKLRVTGICSDNFVFSTLHSEYYSILTDIGIKPNIMTDEESTDALKRACKSLSIRNRTRATYGDITRDELADIACIVTYARNHIDDKRYSHPLCDEYNIKPATLDKLIELFGKYRKAENKQDFEELQELIYTGITTNPAFAQMVANRYRVILIDEFQDVSQIQYAILKTYIASANKAIAIGDDDQCIYSWRGSDIDIITKLFKQDFNPNIHKFTVNYRCRSNILAPVIPSIVKNTNRYDKDLRAFKQGGTVRREETSNVNAVLTDIKTALANRQTVGVLSRTNFDLLAPAILCELDGSFDFSISKAIGINSAIPRQVLGCIKLLTRRYTEDFEDLLRPFCTDKDGYYKNNREAKMIADILNNEATKRLWTFDLEDISYSCPNLYRNLIKPVLAETDKRQAYIVMLRFLMNVVYKGNSPYAIKARMFISFVNDLVVNHVLCKSADINQLDELFTDVLPSNLSKRAYKKKATAVRLTTVHEAKGKEWDTVVLWNDTDGVFPAQVGNHVITQAEFEEERRLHYIAFTRAKEHLTIYSDNTRQSPFLLECDFSTLQEVEPETTKTITKMPDANVAVATEIFTSYVQDILNDTNAQASTELYNILSYHNYDYDKVISVVADKYYALKANPNIAFANVQGDLRQEIEVVISTIHTEIAYNITEATNGTED